MSTLPHTSSPWRVPRLYLEEATPAVLRFANGQSIGANLNVVSLTGGLISLPRLVVPGSRVKLIFLTGAGSVLGGAEMLRPVANALQPFRFVSLAADDHRRLGALIRDQSSPSATEQVWIEKLRAASARQNGAQPWRLKLAGAVGLVTFGLATAAYLLHSGLLK
ncbi:MAG: hypothetical protein ABSF15_21830 [Candidatus Sulfotelmatobacter sp.]